PERFVHYFRFVRTEEKKISFLCSAARNYRFEDLIRKIFDYRRLQSFAPARHVNDFDICQSTRAVDGSKLGVSVDIATGNMTATLYEQCSDPSTGRVGRPGEYFEFDVFHGVGELREHKRDTQVRFVRSILGQSIRKANAWKWIREAYVERFLEHRADQLFHKI